MSTNNPVSGEQVASDEPLGTLPEDAEGDDGAENGQGSEDDPDGAAGAG